MSPILISIAAAVFVMSASLTGVIFTNQALGVWMRQRLMYLATFSAGVLIVLAYHLIEETFHESASFVLAAASVVAGLVMLEVIHRVLPDTHHHHEAPVDHVHTTVDGRRVLISDAVHNVTDGFLIVPAFLVSSTLLSGIALAFTLASFEAFIVVLSGFAAGGFLAVVVRDLLPHALSSAKAHDKWLQHTAAALVGIFIMTSVIVFVPN